MRRASIAPCLSSNKLRFLFSTSAGKWTPLEKRCASSYFSLKQIIRTSKWPINFHAFQSSLRCSFHSRKLCILAPSFYKSTYFSVYTPLFRVLKQIVARRTFSSPSPLPPSFSLFLSTLSSKKIRYPILQC